MKLPLILSLLVGGAVGSKVVNDSIINNINQETVIEDSKKNSDILTAYIDGESKVYLNDINDSIMIEDSWKNTDIKILNLNLDFTDMEQSTRYLEVELPLGMELRMSPGSIVDNKNILSVDDKEFGLNKFKVTGKKEYVANQGRLIYKISPNTQVLNLDLMISIDNKLWNTKNQNPCSDSEKAIIITIGDDLKRVSKKLDKINIIKDMRNNFYGTDHSNYSDTIVMNRDIYFNRWFYSNQNVSLLKELRIEMELPYVEENVDGVIQKKYLQVKNMRLEPSIGEYIMKDDSIVFTWKDTDANLLRMIFDVYADKSLFKDEDKVKITYKNMKFKGIFDDEYYELFPDVTLDVSTIVSDETEKLVLGSINRNLYSSEETNKAVHYLGGNRIVNKGVETKNKKFVYEFNENSVGVKAVSMAVNPSESSHDVVGILWNSDTSENIPVSLTLSKKINDSNNIMLDVNTILKLANIDNVSSENLYIRYIEYNFGSIAMKYQKEPAIYGKILSDTKSLYKNIMNFHIEDTVDESLKKTSQIVTNISSSYTKMYVSTSQNKVLNEEGSEVSEVMAGDSINLTGIVSTSSSFHDNGALLISPQLYVKLPKGFTLNESKTYFKHVDAEKNETILNYEIVNKKNPRVFDDGEIGYLIDIKNEGNIIGHFNEDIKTYGHLKFNVNIEISKSVRSRVLKTSNILYFMDKKLDVGFLKDVFDLDEDGSVTDTVIECPNKQITVLSNASWLEVDNIIEGEDSSLNKYNQDLTEEHQSLNYGLVIENTNEGTVKVGGLEYYIPIPKKGLVYNENIKPKDVEFSFDMELSSIPANIDKHTILYSYDNINYFNYMSEIDLSRVSMVKLINTEEILPGDKYEFSVKMHYKEDSWNKTVNNNSWSAYGVQTYTKNGTDSIYTHVFEPLKVSLKFEPKILESPDSIIASVGSNVVFEASVDLGAPLSTGNWQYRENSYSPWVDLSETSNVLALDGVLYSMNGYEYKYVVSNELVTVESKPALLTVTDNSAPTIKLTELRDGDNYKIKIDVTDEDSGVSHIILPDGRRIDSDTFTMDAVPDIEYIFKAYDLAGNESIAKITVVGGLVPKTVTGNLDVYIKSRNMLSLSLSSNSISFEDFNGTENLEQQGALELTVNSSLPYEINAYLEGEIQNSDKTETMDKSILNLKESYDADYKEFTDVKTKLTLVPHGDAGNNKLHIFDFKLNGGIAHKKDVYKASIKLEVNQK